MTLKRGTFAKILSPKERGANNGFAFVFSVRIEPVDSRPAILE